jgi:hypothetical protein
MADKNANNDHPHPSVRFNSVTEQISPLTNPPATELTKTTTSTEPPETMTEDQRQEIRDLSVSLQQSRIQTNRMNQFIFDPVSLPPSRVIFSHM